MRTKKMVLVTATAIGIAALMAFTMTPNAHDCNKKETVKKLKQCDTTATTSAYPCPCSKFECRCGGDLYWTTKAYKKYSGKKCSFCDGAGCKECDGEGREFFWQPGCKCKKCGNGFKQPNDC